MDGEINGTKTKCDHKGAGIYNNERKEAVESHKFPNLVEIWHIQRVMYRGSWVMFKSILMIPFFLFRNCGQSNGQFNWLC